MTKRSTWGLALAGVLGVVAGSASAQTQTVAVQGGRVVPVVGEPIEQGTVLIRDGRVAAVGGPEVEVPFDATVIDATGKVVFPGLILADTTDGLDRGNESIPVAPFLDVADAVDPSSYAFEDALRDGLTTLHVIQGDDTVIAGLGRAMRPMGLTPSSMSVAPTGLKLMVGSHGGWDRVRQRAQLREAFAEFLDHVEDQAEARYREEHAEDEDTEDVSPEHARREGEALLRVGDIDPLHQNLWRLTRGDLRAYVSCPRAQDVPYALAMAAEMGFLERTVLVLGPDAHKAVDVIAAAQVPVILSANLTYRELDRATGEEREVFVPKVYAEAGVPFALTISERSPYGERYLWYQAARCVAHGVDRDVALRAITQTPADLLGLGDQLGALEAGRDANLLILSGDVLDATTVVEQVLIEGNVVYEREVDHRLRRLTDLDAIDDGASEEDGASEDTASEDTDGEDTDGEDTDGDSEDADGDDAAGEGEGQ